MIRIPLAVILAGLVICAAGPQEKPNQAQPQSALQAPKPAAPAPGKPQQPAAEGQLPTNFTSTTKEVILPVTVTDDKGRFVSNLEKTDFRVLDEGRPQTIASFYHDSRAFRQHTVIGFLVDMSSNTTIHWDKFKEATKEMIWGLLPNDPDFTGYLISYSTTAELAVNTTSDPDKLTDRVDRMKPGGGAALYDAVRMACTDRKLVPGEPYQPRRVIIVVGDGHDTASQYTLDQVIELAQRNYVTVYGVSTLAFGSTSEESDNLVRLATETGGHVEYPLLNPYTQVSGYLSTPSDEGNYALKVGTGGYTAAIAGSINQAVQQLQGEITTQYILRYVPEIDPETAYKDKRKIKVEVMSLPAGSVKVQTRPYYYANPVK